MRAFPRVLPRLLGFMSFSPAYLRHVQERAAESHERQYAGDYAYDHVAGDGRTFDYGVDYTECGAAKSLTEHGARELAPYVCATDMLSSRAFGWGLMRTTTLAEGAARCDFRFKRSGETRVAAPASLELYISRRSA